jgi:hypothetical protein
VGVNSNTGVGVDRSCTKISGLVFGIETAVVGIPPIGVGVWYCPHNDTFPTHAESMEAEIKRTMARFTDCIIPALINKP